MIKIFWVTAIIIAITCYLTPSWASEAEKESAVLLEPVVVTATRTETPIHQVSSSITVITAQDIAQQAPNSIAEILRNVPGLKITQLRGPGSFTKLTIRGAKSSQVLILIDGQPITDPSSLGNDLNMFLGQLLPDDVERIEIIRGTQSTLYGSDAIGGVINIITKKGVGKPQYNLFFEGGSENSFRETISSSGRIRHKIAYSFTFARQNTDRIDDHDNYKNNTFSGKLDIDLRDDLQLTLQGRYLDVLQELDNFDSIRFRNFDDPNYTRESQISTWAATLIQNFTPWWEYKLTFSETTTDRSYHDNPNPPGYYPGFPYRGYYQGKTRNIDWQHNFYYQEVDIFTAGIEYEEQWTSTRYESFPWSSYIARMHQKTRNLGYYFHNQLKLKDQFFLTLGLRIDDNDDFGTEYNLKGSIAYLIPKSGTKLKGNYGSGFKAPSLFQLHSQYGSPSLNPEESDSFDIGIEQTLWDGRIKLGITWFYLDLDNLIAYDFSTRHYKNISKAKTQGLECELKFTPFKVLTIAANYTFINSENKVTGKEIPGVPNDKLGFNINYRFLEKFNLNFDLTYVGDSQYNESGSLINDAYTKADLVLSYDLKPNLQLYFRGNNLFDQDIVENGFQGPPAWVYGGIRARF
jgi:vitamin B12 transporter